MTTAKAVPHLTEAHTERFWSRVDKSGGTDACWPWVAKLDAYGYGVFSINGKVVKAHRVAKALSDEASLEGLTVNHSCDNPPCCNPLHLVPSTQAENLREMFSRGRGNPSPGLDKIRSLPPHPRAKGEAHGMAKLTESDVLSIRARVASGTPQRQICRELGLHPSHVSNIVRGRVWRHLGGAEC